MILDALDRLNVFLPLLPGLQPALSFLQRDDLKALPDGRYELDGDRVYALLQSYRTTSAEGGRLEAHRRYIDLQCLLAGRERCGYAALTGGLRPVKDYDPENDCAFFAGTCDFFTLTPTNFALFWPQDTHMPGRHFGKGPEDVRKVVIKLRRP